MTLSTMQEVTWPNSILLYPVAQMMSKMNIKYEYLFIICKGSKIEPRFNMCL
jgi:hypothetical protein